MVTPVETVYTIFKTHLDLGFTDLAQNVVQQYFDRYIPQAIATAETLRQTGRPERFIWTTGAWLIYQYLEEATPAQRKHLEKAIAAGDITWHALPFTMHCELLDASLFRFGLRFSQELDRRFGKKTIAAKMTDVPGHTRAIVPLLAEAGVEFLHVGVNEASTMPEVPPVFVWQDEGGAEVVVMYQHAYGGLMVVPGLSAAITFAHTNDNLGPQTAGEVIQIFQELQCLFPGARITASTLDAYAQALLPLKSQLAVVTQEIADTWIHGVGTDPQKVSRFRELCRLRNYWLANPASRPDEPALAEFSHRLLLVAEHTWGMDVKSHLADYTNYRRDQFDRVKGQENFKKMAASWAEQRVYLEQALQALGNSPFAHEARDQLKAIEPAVPDKKGYEPVADAGQRFDTTHFTLRFDPVTGAIVHLLEKKSGHGWASAEHPLGWFRYQTFSEADYVRFLDQYLASRPEWAVPDFSKPGLTGGDSPIQWWQARLTALWWRRGSGGDHFILELSLPEECTARLGGPQVIILTVNAPDSESALLFDLQWFQKPANRQPEAFWFSFCPPTSRAADWFMEKMGKWISPLQVVRNGNRKLHAVGQGVVSRDGRGELIIETLDAPLVAPGEPFLLDFNNEQPDMQKGVHVNLYNNVWGTNFPMWYGDDARFRFAIRLVYA